MKLCGFEVGLDRPLFLIAGPCVIESRQMALDTDHEHRQWLENVLQRREQKEKQLKWQARC